MFLMSQRIKITIYVALFLILLNSIVHAKTSQPQNDKIYSGVFQLNFNEFEDDDILLPPVAPIRRGGIEGNNSWNPPYPNNSGGVPININPNPGNSIEYPGPPGGSYVPGRPAPYNPYFPGQQNNNANGITIGLSTETPADFQCNLFDNPDYDGLLKAVGALKNAMHAEDCIDNTNPQGNANVEMTVKQIEQSIKMIRGVAHGAPPASGSRGDDQSSSGSPNKQANNYSNLNYQNPSYDPYFAPNGSGNTYSPFQGGGYNGGGGAATVVSDNVNSIISGISAISQKLSKNNLFSKNCKPNTIGDMAYSLGSLLNGVAPLALKAVSLTGSSAAIPYILGGQAISSGLEAVGKILRENTVNINDPMTRRAILENTCQYIKIQQRYEFLTKDRDAQIRDLQAELSKTTEQIQKKTQMLSYSMQMSEKNIPSSSKIANKQTTEVAWVQQSLTQAQESLSGLSSELIAAGSNNYLICGIGQTLLKEAQKNNEGFPKNIFSALDKAAAINNDQASLAVKALINQSHFFMKSRFNSKQLSDCVELTKSWVSTIQRAASLTQKYIEEPALSLQPKNQNYFEIIKLNQIAEDKNDLVKNIVSAVDNIKKQNGSFNRSEFNVEIKKLRDAFFTNVPYRKSLGFISDSLGWIGKDLEAPSPAESWILFQISRNEEEVEAFQKSFSGLGYWSFKLNLDQFNKQKQKTQTQFDKMLNASYRELSGLNAKTIKPGSGLQKDACREVGYVWRHWIAAVDHIESAELYCSMISQYIYNAEADDNRLINLCRGRTSHGTYKIKAIKNEMRKKYRKRAELLYGKLFELKCI